MQIVADYIEHPDPLVRAQKHIKKHIKRNSSEKQKRRRKAVIKHVLQLNMLNRKKQK